LLFFRQSDLDCEDSLFSVTIINAWSFILSVIWHQQPAFLMPGLPQQAVLILSNQFASSQRKLFAKHHDFIAFSNL